MGPVVTASARALPDGIKLGFLSAASRPTKPICGLYWSCQLAPEGKLYKWINWGVFSSPLHNNKG